MKPSLPLALVALGAPLAVHAKPQAVVDIGGPRTAPQAMAGDDIWQVRPPARLRARGMRNRPMADPSDRVTTPVVSSWVAMPKSEFSPVADEASVRVNAKSRRAFVSYDLVPGHMAASVGFLAISASEPVVGHFSDPAHAILPPPSNRILGGSLRLAF